MFIIDNNRVSKQKEQYRAPNSARTEHNRSRETKPNTSKWESNSNPTFSSVATSPPPDYTATNLR